MARPILFSSVSREKFDNIPEEDKKKKNYQIKEEDGTVSKYISNLEGGTGGSGVTWLQVTTTDNNWGHWVTINTRDEIDSMFEEGLIGVSVSISDCSGGITKVADIFTGVCITSSSGSSDVYVEYCGRNLYMFNVGSHPEIEPNHYLINY